MPGEITRAAPMYVQVADVLAREITDQTLNPGDLLPSEAEMERRFKVSRSTVRSAINALRSMGLIEVRQGKGSIVLGAAREAATVSRAITRTGQAYALPSTAMPEVEAPAVSRATIDGVFAQLLGRDGEDAISVDRMLYEETTGSRIAHRLIVPFATASQLPALHDQPSAPLDEVYAQLHTCGPLNWTEEVTARTPFPDERTALGLTDTSSPILITYRTTYGKDQPLICEQLKAPAAHLRLAYPITATKPTAKAARIQQT